jgi:ESS family glutamate:Na+ symporter
MPNFIGIVIFKHFGGLSIISLIPERVSLIGGHGTTIAWCPELEQKFDAEGFTECVIVCATLCLILSSVVSIPISRYLIKPNGLKSIDQGDMDVGVKVDVEAEKKIKYMNL